MTAELRDTLSEKGIHLTLEDSALDYLVKKSYSATYGARNLRRLIQKELEDPIATRIIENYHSPITQITVTATGEALELLTM